MYSSWEVVDLWSDRYRQSEGYILLEALISMSILVMLLVGTMPYFIEVFDVRHQAKNNVELNRILYETAQFWERIESESMVISGNMKAAVTEATNKITVKGEDGNETEVEILSIMWKE